MSKTTPENKLTNAVIDLLHIHGYKVKKIFNGGVPARAIGGKIIYKTKPAEYRGVPDLLAYYPHRDLLFVEVKANKNTATPEQKAFIGDVLGISNVKGLILNEKAWRDGVLEEYIREQEIEPLGVPAKNLIGNTMPIDRERSVGVFIDKNIFVDKDANRIFLKWKKKGQTTRVALSFEAALATQRGLRNAILLILDILIKKNKEQEKCQNKGK